MQADIWQQDPIDLLAAPYIGYAWLAGPLLLMLGLTISAIRQRKPVAASVARGVRNSAVPMASFLFIAFVLLAFFTLHQEARIADNVRRENENEGRYMATLLGVDWPDLPSAPPITP